MVVNEGEALVPAERTGAGSGAVALGIPRVGLPTREFGAGFDLAPKPMKVVLNWGRKYSLWVFNFGLACCAIEFIAASMARHDFIRLGVIPFAPGPRQADLMVVSGTVSDKMAPAVKRLYEQMPEPKYVISFGACANCGGPYWDSYSVTKGIDQVIPVDVYVPGCPPRPEALLQGIVRLQEKIAAEGTGDRGAANGRAVANERNGANGRAKALKARWQRSVPAARPESDPVQPVVPVAAVAPPLSGESAVPEERPVPPVAAPPRETCETAAAEEPSAMPAPAFEAPTVEVQRPQLSSAEALTVEVPVVEAPTMDLGPTRTLPKIKVPRRHYFRELRRARDHGLSLFDKAARDQEWEYDDES